MARLVNLGGRLCVEIPASVFGPGALGPVNGSARYDVSTAGQTITATFQQTGQRALGVFGLVASSMKRAIGMTSKYGVDVDAEAKALGWRAGRAVQVAANAQAFTLTFS